MQINSWIMHEMLRADNEVPMTTERWSENGSQPDDCYSVESREGHPMDVVSPLVETVLMVLICAGNGAVFAVFWRRPAAHLRSLAQYFILQLAIADFSVGLAMPFHVALYFQRPILYDSTVCVLRYATLMLSGSASVTALLAMSYDRYLAIVRPLQHYSSTLSWRRALLSALFIWLPPLALAFFLPLLWHNAWPTTCPRDCDMVVVLKTEYFYYVMFPAIPLVAVTMVYLYGRVLAAARGHVRRLSCQDAKTSARKAREKQRRHELKMFKTCLIVITVFCACWLPYCVITALQIFGDLYESDSLQIARNVAVFVAVFNSAMNPIIYAFRLRGFRREVVALVSRRRSEAYNESSTGDNRHVAKAVFS